MSATLVLVRHGEIVRPPYSSNLDRAPLSLRGESQIRDLAGAWPVARPTTVIASPLRRSIESAIVLATAFGLSVSKRACLQEWSADDSGIPQAEYMALEHRAWADFGFVPPNKESLAQASIRSRRCLEEIAATHDGATTAIVGHGTMFSLVTAGLKGDAPTEAYKNSIGFGAAAILDASSSLRLVSDFRSYPPRTGSIPNP